MKSEFYPQESGIAKILPQQNPCTTCNSESKTVLDSSISRRLIRVFIHSLHGTEPVGWFSSRVSGSRNYGLNSILSKIFLSAMLGFSVLYRTLVFSLLSHNASHICRQGGVAWLRKKKLSARKTQGRSVQIRTYARAYSWNLEKNPF